MWKLLLVIVLALTVRSVARRLRSWLVYHPPYGKLTLYALARYRHDHQLAARLHPDVERHISKCCSCYLEVYNVGGWGAGPKMGMKPPEEVFATVD